MSPLNLLRPPSARSRISFPIVETAAHRIRVADTDIGAELKESIRYLEELLAAYMDGTLIEKGV